MHADEVETDIALAGRLIAAQFPHWANLPLAPVPSTGTDNALYRLGDALVVRLPRIAGAVGQIAKEHHWLPRLAPRLPLPIPAVLARGVPGAGYPLSWAVYRWLAGEVATPEHVADPRALATDLTRFIAALQRIDPAGGPPSSRGLPLATRDAAVRAALVALRGMIDTDAATAAWETALRAPAWPGPPLWSHGDLQPGNLLTVAGRLSAVIDFGCLGVGDPACELIVAWNLFSGDARAAFRAALGVDDATWARGRGWALCNGLLALPYYRHTNPAFAEQSRRTIVAVLDEHRHGA
jgi:aminoglycoside phosphotransferase (APT) family kinase protein